MNHPFLSEFLPFFGHRKKYLSLYFRQYDKKDKNIATWTQVSGLSVWCQEAEKMNVLFQIQRVTPFVINPFGGVMSHPSPIASTPTFCLYIGLFVLLFQVFNNLRLFLITRYLQGLFPLPEVYSLWNIFFTRLTHSGLSLEIFSSEKLYRPLWEKVNFSVFSFLASYIFPL